MPGEHGEPDELVYLTVEDALEIYAAIIDGTPEQARDHLRSREALEGALARPESYAHYEQADLALQASVLAHGIAETQPCVDGNKRMALVAMLTFLEINGYTVSATDPQLADCSLRSAAVKNIYTINADGTDLTQVSNGGTDGPADWGTHPLAS